MVAPAILAEQDHGLGLGMFMMPINHPDTPLSEAIDWNLKLIRLADQLGYSEVWIGKHMTSKYERVPSPQLLIARALGETDRIVLATGVEILYQQHPITLALELAQLDHMARGRLMFGFGAGATKTDNQLYGVDHNMSQEMAAEALDIILNVWQAGGPKDYKGKFWRVCAPNPMAAYGQDLTHGWHVQPYAPVEQRVAFAGFGATSVSLGLAGARGYIPLSLNISNEYLKGHWSQIEKGAASTGRTPSRSRWRHAKEVYVAETKAEARKAALEGFLRTYWHNYAYSFFSHSPDMMNLFRRSGADPHAPVTAEYLIDEGVWFVGDPDSVADQICEQYDVCGGFGTLLQLGMDYSRATEREGWIRSMELLAREVMPRVRRRLARVNVLSHT